MAQKKIDQAGGPETYFLNFVWPKMITFHSLVQHVSCYNNILVGHMTSPMDHMIYTLTLDSPQLIKVNNNIER